jgi:hypothetical protein
MGSFQKLVEKIQVSLKSDKNKCYFTWRPIYIFYHNSLISSYNEKCFRKKSRKYQNTHFVFNNIFLENRAVSEIMWKMLVKPDRLKMAIWRMNIACWITGATDTPSDNEILITLPLQQRLHNTPHVKFVRTQPVFFILHCIRRCYCQMRTAERNKATS